MDENLNPQSAAVAHGAVTWPEPPPRAVLITGCSSGFGRLTALTLARAGHQVYASMRDTRTANADEAEELRAIAAQENLTLEVVDIDVRDERSVKEGTRLVHDRAGRIDVLVNNAGIYFPAILETLTIADLQAVLDTNLFGSLRMNRAVLPFMRARRDGLIVQITSALGRLVMPFVGAYGASKWALEATTEILRYEVSKLGVDVVMVEPGAHPTDIIEPNGVAYYQEYLRGLDADDALRRAEYGDLARRAEVLLVENPEGAPQTIADAVATLVRTPRGLRPVRVADPSVGTFLGPLNALSGGLQRQVMKQFGFEDMLSVEP
ncbi:SDR family oxidoreductase [Thermomonospora umbrina]|uniref:NADP-dependent 3-hydroxy acid dehydrogenase YdfG n=1 Tax=Thermomonospora umbrina TaxID=111806 RepID=A0A3D9SW59_9ACTN|nr:SDR family oxidoreductase [Thermomonospora umbrina]REE98750.1 NADP-dependent 3-hydroxy acid dehydrogenase YdfG [Thermomonospora umbrina]